MFLARTLRRILRVGDVTLEGPQGDLHQIRATAQPRVHVRIKDAATLRWLTLRPSYYLAQAYVEGALEIREGQLRDLLAATMESLGERSSKFVDCIWAVVERSIDWIVAAQGLCKSEKNAQFHYDLSNDFFSKFLDQNWQYSCAYFETGHESLEEAQEAKMRHIAAKLHFERPATTVLDIGCGWGSLLGFLAANYDVHGLGISLSKEQLRFARDRRYSPNVSFELQDYRKTEGRFSRILSVGMLEHVGQGHYRQFFRKVSHLLSDDGLALIHTIGRRGPPAPINPWIRRHIFPGAYLPSLSQLAEAIEGSNLWLLDLENLRLHYAETLAHWQSRLKAHESDIKSERGDRFYRAWEFYLVSGELGFRHSGLTVFQLLLGKKPNAAPITRQYMFDEEERLKRSAAQKHARRA